MHVVFRLSGVPLLRGSETELLRGFGFYRRQRHQLLEILTLAGWARGRGVAAHQCLEAVAARAALEIEERHAASSVIRCGWHAGERGDNQRGPLRAEPAVWSVFVPFCKRMGVAAASAAIDRDRRDSQAHWQIGVGAR